MNESIICDRCGYDYDIRECDVCGKHVCSDCREVNECGVTVCLSCLPEQDNCEDDCDTFHDGDCPACGGSGGGDRPYHCLACGGTGTRGHVSRRERRWVLRVRRDGRLAREVV